MFYGAKKVMELYWLKTQQWGYNESRKTREVEIESIMLVLHSRDADVLSQQHNFAEAFQHKKIDLRHLFHWKNQ